MVEQAEGERTASYLWLLRTRTDVLYMEDLRLGELQTGNAYVPAGMTQLPQFKCMGDHIFLCPRSLCRPYFMVLELLRKDGKM